MHFQLHTCMYVWYVQINVRFWAILCGKPAPITIGK